MIEPTLKILKKFLGPVYEFLHPMPLPQSHPYFCVLLTQRGRVGLRVPSSAGSGSSSSFVGGRGVSGSSAAASSIPVPPPHPAQTPAVAAWSAAGASTPLQLSPTQCPALKRTAFPTDMGRELLSCSVLLDDLAVRLHTSHLESQKIGAEKRKRQLDMALEEVVG